MADHVVSGVKLVPIGLSHDEVFGPTRDWCSWDRMYGKEYLVPAFTLLSRQRVQQIAEVTEEAYRLIRKAVRFTQQEVPDEYLVHQLGISPALCEIVREHVPYDGITRFDLSISENGVQILEYNADTPTGVVETAYVSEAVIRRFSTYANPSSAMNEAIRKAIQALCAYYRQRGFTGPLVYSAAGEHVEDRGTVEYTRAQAGNLGSFVPLEQLRVEADGLYALDEKISIWYRLYPWEHLPYDQDETGFATGEYLIHLIAEQKVAAISPPQALIPQSKGMQALIWELAQLRHPLFDDTERQFIRQHFLPSAFEPDSFLRSGIAYVSKPFFGREGGAVTLYSAVGEVEERDREQAYWDQPMLYQQRVELPDVVLSTEEGDFAGHLLLGSFCIGGRFAGLLPRVGGKITGNLAYFTPAAMER
ncbi:glutathionylspermidine synthase family protein [Brevibacillus humidisoli]|uniref:glutathionylspermidine synthase family protein n=1 Tax=Brevibacillus humidisoli TaxID=2895522 RepID=UPI001E557A1C|nr:glutathionylspermidine synthase family protein [Brevibacillus humidisoli]UFJ42724.1 glutathionylspermidine synthase family protein [Brevibacillus humidisoli]